MFCKFGVEIESRRMKTAFPRFQYRATIGSITGNWKDSPQMAIQSAVTMSTMYSPNSPVNAPFEEEKRVAKEIYWEKRNAGN